MFLQTCAVSTGGIHLAIASEQHPDVKETILICEGLKAKHPFRVCLLALVKQH